jgi:hypothetical protein
VEKLVQILPKLRYPLQVGGFFVVVLAILATSTTSVTSTRAVAVVGFIGVALIFFGGVFDKIREFPVTSRTMLVLSLFAMFCVSIIVLVIAATVVVSSILDGRGESMMQSQRLAANDAVGHIPLSPSTVSGGLAQQQKEFDAPKVRRETEALRVTSSSNSPERVTVTGSLQVVSVEGIVTLEGETGFDDKTRTAWLDLSAPISFEKGNAIEFYNVDVSHAFVRVLRSGVSIPALARGLIKRQEQGGMMIEFTDKAEGITQIVLAASEDIHHAPKFSSIAWFFDEHKQQRPKKVKNTQ